MVSLRRVTICCAAVWVWTAASCNASMGDALGARIGVESAWPLLATESATLAEVADGAFARIGRAMVDSDAFAPAAGAELADVKRLPAAPAAVAMTLVGFLCVSLARDRRVWLGLACGLIWLAQAGVTAAPQLLRRMCGRAAAEAAEACGCVHFDGVGRPSGCDVSVRYVGLLRRLAAIPAEENPSQIRSADLDIFNKFEFPKPRIQSAAAPAVWDALLFNAGACPGRTIREVVTFSPAFIFSNLSRGPPIFS
jgi:hypothetical protein